MITEYEMTEHDREMAGRGFVFACIIWFSICGFFALIVTLIGTLQFNTPNDVWLVLPCIWTSAAPILMFMYGGRFYIHRIVVYFAKGGTAQRYRVLREAMG